MFLECIRIVSGLWKVSGRCLGGVWKAQRGSQEDVWRVDDGCFKGAWNKNPNLISTRRKGPMCLESVCKAYEIFFESCLEGV